MKISIVIPAFNEERLLGETLRGVHAAAEAFVRRGWESEVVVCDNNGWVVMDEAICAEVVVGRPRRNPNPDKHGRRASPIVLFPLPAQCFSTTHPSIMAKALTKSQILTTVVQTVGLTKKQAGETLEALVALAYKNAKNSFTIPGLGKLVLVNRKARMGRNPATGATIKIAAKKVVKFRVAKAAKDAILGTK